MVSIGLRCVGYLDVPMLSQGCDDALFDWSSAGSANWNAHFIVAAEAVELVHVVGGKPRPASHFAGCVIQFDAAVGTIEMVRVVHFAPELQGFVVDETTEMRKFIM